MDWRAWEMPADAHPPAKPEGYGENAKKFLQTLLDQLGLQIQPPNKKAKTFLAHVGGKYAKEQGVYEAYQQAIFEAIWQNSESVEDKKILSQIAKKVGLSPAAFEGALENPSYIKQVMADFQLAVDQKIWTIPSYQGENGTIQVNHFKDLPTIKELEKLIR
ncbi:putative DsbA family dithiol-disulfide isomerase [Ammoniphilus resinae]|uniref:DsbA family dithiol-disulfide isomerase n=1 Tax=Ammoniphilus resinae TaxID=861532 RepID=A0ABS4GLU5_9BACL|nr:DsbA family protein [Ammoniphilus resinae]MBP1931247.1 putative DsbA family dithiol-disulfide isomerase [Ammoniphilus resinae]